MLRLYVCLCVCLYPAYICLLSAYMSPPSHAVSRGSWPSRVPLICCLSRLYLHTHAHPCPETNRTMADVLCCQPRKVQEEGRLCVCVCVCGQSRFFSCKLPSVCIFPSPPSSRPQAVRALGVDERAGRFSPHSCGPLVPTDIIYISASLASVGRYSNNRTPPKHVI